MKKIILAFLVSVAAVSASFALDLSVGGGVTGSFNFGILATPTVESDLLKAGTAAGISSDYRFGVKANVAIDYAELSVGYSYMSGVIAYGYTADGKLSGSKNAAVIGQSVDAHLLTVELLGKLPSGQAGDPFRFETTLGLGMALALAGKTGEAKITGVEKDPLAVLATGSLTNDTNTSGQDFTSGGTKEGLYTNNSLAYSDLHAILGFGGIFQLAENMTLTPRLSFEYSFLNFGGSKAKFYNEYVTFNHWNIVNLNTRFDLVFNYKLMSF